MATFSFAQFLISVATLSILVGSVVNQKRLIRFLERENAETRFVLQEIRDKLGT